MSHPPLSGVRVLVTRPREQAEAWREPLERAGASVIVYPAIAVVPPPSWRPLDDALAQLDSYDWLLFTSANAVRHAGQRVPSGLDVRALTRPRIAAVGTETARAVEALGWRVELSPARQSQEGLTAALSALPAGTRILFPQAIGGREALVQELAARGCVVDVVPASATRPELMTTPPAPFDVATFASPSALRAFVAARGVSELDGTPVVVVGPTTATEAQAHNLAPVVADAPNVHAVIRSIIAVIARP